jgi:hypothetical protein
VTDSVITMAQAMRVGIALVYLLVVLLRDFVLHEIEAGADVRTALV